MMFLLLAKLEFTYEVDSSKTKNENRIMTGKTYGGMPECIGRVISAEWHEPTKSVKFVLEFGSRGIRIGGSCKSGKLNSEEYISPADLKAKLPQIKNLKVYDHSGTFDPDKLTPEAARKMRFQISLKGGGIRYLPPKRPVDANTFLSRLLG